MKRSGVRNRRNPYKSLDRRVLDVARLHVLKLKYGLVDVLPPKRPRQDVGEIFPERQFFLYYKIHKYMTYPIQIQHVC